jgi:hypothetical protein
VPKYADLQRRAAASRVVDDVDLVRNAVYKFYSDSAYFPAEPATGGGSVPAELVLYLPRGFSFNRGYGTFAYKNWPKVSEVPITPEDSAQAHVIGLTVTTSDPRIGAKAASMLPTTAEFTVANKFTFLFFGS